MTRHDLPSRPRCAAVWLAATAAVAVVVPWLLGGVDRPATFEQALTDLAAAAGIAAGVWLWMLVTLTTLDAVRGRAREPRAGVPVGVRRVVLAACGVALASGGLAVPAHADDGHAHPSVLTGLPLPDRPSTLGNLGLAFQVARATAVPGLPTHRHPSAPRSDDGTVVVAAGDTLWAIAERHLPVGAGPDAIGRACRRLYQFNRAVIGDDPDLIHPGQRLRLPALLEEAS